MSKLQWCVWVAMLIGISTTLQAQTVYEGKIEVKGTHEPVSEVICLVTDLKNETVFAYTISDKNGQYRLQFHTEADSVCLRFVLLGYKTECIVCENRSGYKNITLEPEQVKLKEVIVKASPVWSKGDTLNFQVDALKSQEDQVIGDVLKKLPGIKVSEKGAITYQGKPINRFYIEGMDLLREKYSIATNNIPANVVDRVQILENHQPVKMLENRSFSEQAALNLKLKNEKLGRPIINGEVGGGATDKEGLWKGKVMGMEVVRKWQSLFTVKTNNTGLNLADELSGHSLEIADLLVGIPPYPENVIESGNLFSLPVEEKRYLQNRSYVFTANQLWRMGEDSQLRLTMTYLHDRSRQQMQELNRYLLGTEELIWNTYNKQENKMQAAEAIVSWTTNSADWYMDEELKAYGKWNKVLSRVRGTQQVDPFFKLPLFLIQNKLDITRSVGKKMWNGYSFFRYSAQPQYLKMQEDTLSVEGKGLLRQRADRKKFYTHNRTGFSWEKGKSFFKLGVAFTAAIEHFSSDLYPDLFETDSMRNRLRWNRWAYQVEPMYTLKGEDMQLEITVPFVTEDLYAYQKDIAEREHFIRFRALPSLRFSYTFNAYWRSSFSYQLKNELGDALDFAEGIYMSDFRTFRKGISVPEERTSHSYTMGVNYRNPLNVLFFTFSAIYRLQHVDLSFIRDFSADYMVNRKEKNGNDRNYLILNSRVGKYWNRWKTNFSFEAGYIRTSFEQFQQQNSWEVIGHNLQMLLSINCEPVSWNSLTLQAGYRGNKMKTVKYNSDWLAGWTTKFAVYFFPTSRWQVGWKGEYVKNELADAPDLRLFFMDTEVKYSCNRWEFAFTCDNIFNKDVYSSSSYDGVNTYSSSILLRPRALLLTLGVKF